MLRDLLGCGVEAELCDVVRLRRRLPRVCAVWSGTSLRGSPR